MRHRSDLVRWFQARSTITEIDTYTFSAYASDTVVIRIDGPSGSANLNPDIRLCAPNGTLLKSQWSYDNLEMLHTLPDNGEYNIMLGDHHIEYTGNYNPHRRGRRDRAPTCSQRHTRHRRGCQRRPPCHIPRRAHDPAGGGRDDIIMTKTRKKVLRSSPLAMVLTWHQMARQSPLN